MRKLIIALILGMVLLSVIVAGECPADASPEDKKNNPQCTEFEVSADNIASVQPSDIQKLDSSKLTPQVIQKMSDSQIKALTVTQIQGLNDVQVNEILLRDKETIIEFASALKSNQLTPEVLWMLSDKEVLGNVKQDEVITAVNSLGGVQITGIAAGGLGKIKITGTTADSMFIEDANGNGIRATTGGKANIKIDENGVIYIEEGENLGVWHNGNRVADFSGTGSVDADGTFVCEGACSVSGTDISVLIEQGDALVKMVFTGQANVEVDEFGAITRMDGLLQGPHKELIFAAADGGYHATFHGAEIHFDNGEFVNVKTDNLVIIDYIDGRLDAEGNTIPSAHLLMNGGSFSMSGTDSVQVTECSVKCTYENRDDAKMNGLTLPEGGYLEMNANAGGTFRFDSTGEVTLAEISGENSAVSIYDANNNPLAGVRNSEEGSTKVVIGDSRGLNLINEDSINNYACLTPAPCDDKNRANLALLMGPQDVAGFMTTDNSFALTVGEDWVDMQKQGTTSIASLIVEESGSYPEIDVGLWKKLEVGGDSQVASIQVDGVNINVKRAGISGASTDSLAIDYPKDNDLDGKYVVSATGLDGREGEALYSDGQNQVLLEVTYGINGNVESRTLLTPKGVFRNSIDDNGPLITYDTLRSFGLSNEEITSLQNKNGDNYFSETEIANINNYNNPLYEAPKQAEPVAAPGEPPKAEVPCPPETPDCKPAEAPAEPQLNAQQQAIAAIDPASVSPGTVNGKLLTNDPNAVALMNSLCTDNAGCVCDNGGADCGIAERFQNSVAGIRSDGKVGMQTSTAILHECYTNPGKCDQANLNSFEQTVLTPVSTNVANANANLGDSNVRRTTPTEQKQPDGSQLQVVIPTLPAEPSQGTTIEDTEGFSHTYCNGVWIADVECPKEETAAPPAAGLRPTIPQPALTPPEIVYVLPNQETVGAACEKYPLACPKTTEYCAIDTNGDGELDSSGPCN